MGAGRIDARAAQFQHVPVHICHSRGRVPHHAATDAGGVIPEGTSSGSDAEGDSLASEWLDHTAAAIAKDLESHVLGIKKLGTQGSLQLTTDLEYVCNVIAALGVALPLPLSTAISLTACQDEASFQDLVLWIG
eukprot:TRINITY_DN104721_c0_g1_i1.p2 TRINITY_DN104721_c0_g1~~TRINITY_DN104721_c0_g1_i1.p2  ORF type:complete len:134 (-),score=16.74 TRINITY_DN104721_c0_g1_i1:177-578(-)